MKKIAIAGLALAALSAGALAHAEDVVSSFNGFIDLPIVKPDVEMPVVEMYLR